MSSVRKFPSMDAKKIRRLLRSLGYAEVPGTQKGSHVWLEAADRGRIRWAFHDRELASVEVKNLLTRQVGLTLDEALEVIRRG